MATITSSPIYKLLRKAADKEDYKEVGRILRSLRAADRADCFRSLNAARQVDVVRHLKPKTTASILRRLPQVEIEPLLAKLNADDLLPVLDRMAPDDAADVINALPEETADALLPQMHSASLVRQLISYADDTAGALMTTSVLTISEQATAKQALAAVRRWHKDSERLYNLFVTAPGGHLVGMVELLDLIQASPTNTINRFMNTEVISVHADTDQEDCAKLLDRYDQITLPVVDDARRVLGVIAVDDLIDVLQEEADEDIAHLGGAVPLEGNYLKTSVVSMVKKRASWLILLFLAASLTTSIIAAFEEQLATMALLAVFIPLLIGTGGNAGAQTTTTIIRAMALGDVNYSDAVRIWFKEARVGLLLGAVMAIMTSLLAIIMFGQPALAVTVGATIFCIVMAATFTGAILPIAAERMGLDPTLLSGPAITTLVDSVGLLIYFSIAKLVLGI